jgi:outer membrane protein assembly factor BamB
MRAAIQLGCLASCLAVCWPQASVAADPMDWHHWRGPTANGVSYEKGLLEKWSLKSSKDAEGKVSVQGEGLLWRKEEYASRSTPVVMKGKVYLVCRAFPESTKEGEKVVCLDAKTGNLVWESIHNVYLTDSPAERVGWSSVIGDPESGNIYVLGLGCLFQCLEGATGKILWQRPMSEEYGMLSTYGGRTNFPTLFEDLVIISGVMTGWGDTAVPAHRFVAFDKRTGASVWLTSTKLRPEDTTYSTPVFTTFRGQAAMVVGAADGAVYAFQPRTGKVIWKYQASLRGINTTPLVDADGIVYGCQGENNAFDTSILGSLFAFDGNTEGDIPEDKLLWKIPAKTVGKSSPVKIGERIYFVEDGALLLVVDSKTGSIVGQKKLGRVMFGSLVTAESKIYAAENTGRLYIMKPSEKGVDSISETRLPQGEEVFGSPAISHGRIYIPTTEALYCFGNESGASTADTMPALGKESPFSEDTQVAQIQLAPVELMLAPGQTARYQLRAYNKKGQYLKLIHDAEIKIEGGGEMAKDLSFTAPSGTASAAVLITAKMGEMTSTARVRVIPPMPWKFDFADKKVPATWIGATYRHQPKAIDNEDALVKISTIPKGTRSQAWMGWTTMHDYTIQADFQATEKGGRLPDMGLINQRYTLDLQGSQKLQIRSWASRLELRFAKTIDFPWQANTWYTMKFQSENKDGAAVLRGKVWKRGEAEPSDWQIEASDATPNTTGSPGLFGNAADAEFYLDNVQVHENSKAS